MIKLVSENQVKTILTILEGLQRKPYDELNNFLGSITIEEMNNIHDNLNVWYQKNVLKKEYDEELGWIDRNEDY